MSEPDREEQRQDVNAVRYALGGATDEGTLEIERRVAAGDTELARRVQVLRVARDVLRDDADGAPGDVVMGRLRAMARAAEPLPPEQEWLIALPVGAALGVRGALARDAVLGLETDELTLTVTLGTSSLRRGLAVTGQLAAPDGEALPDVGVALVVDHREVQATQSDALGEFAFATVEGRELVLRLDAGYGPHFVLLRRGNQTG